MDQLLTPDFWKVQLAIVASAPWLIAPLLLVCGVIGWFICSRINKGQIEGLRAQLNARDERLQLAREKEQDVTDKLAVARAKMRTLQDQVPIYVTDRDALQVVQASVGSSITAIEQANSSSNVLRSTLSEDARRVLDQAPVTSRSD
jgi:hypothetical protein